LEEAWAEELKRGEVRSNPDVELFESVCVGLFAVGARAVEAIRE